MVFCIAALAVFGVLGIFSAKYRGYFKEALRCVSRQATLRKCDTGFDNKMKSRISSRLAKKSPAAARFVYRNFSKISWAFTAILFLSIASVGVGVYNAAVYGNCNGDQSTEFCVFNPSQTGDSGFSAVQGAGTGRLTPASADDDPYLGGKDANVTVIEFGCFSCKYTKKAEATREQLLEKYGDRIKFVFRNFPLPQHNFSTEAAEASDCALEQGKYWEYHRKLFENQANMSLEKIRQMAADVGADGQQFGLCLSSRKYKGEVEKDYQDGLKSGIYGTPTFFINGRPLVGPQSLDKFSKIIDEELATAKS